MFLLMSFLGYTILIGISAGTVNYHEDGEPVLVPVLSLHLYIFYKVTRSHIFIYYKNMAQKRYIGQGSGKGKDSMPCPGVPLFPHLHIFTNLEALQKETNVIPPGFL